MFRRLLYSIFVITAVFASLTPLWADQSNVSPLWLVREKGKVGYIDGSGEMAIRPRFDDGAAFSDGLAAVRQRGKWGFIDTNGKMVVPPRFDVVGAFSGGLAAFKSRGKWGFVDKTGRIVTRPGFNWVMGFREGMALVEANGRYGYVDSRGDVSVGPRFTDAGEFWEGLARVKVRGRWGFIDRMGKTVVDPRYDYAGNFHEGLAEVEKDGKHGYIDTAGNQVIPFAFEGHRMEGFSEGLAIVVVGKKYGYIDRSGNMAIPPRYWLAWDFQEGAARVQTDDAKWVLINKAGEQVSASAFDHIDDFHDGLARVRVFRDYGFVSPGGTLAVPVGFTGALPFSEGLAAVYVGGSHRQLPIEDPMRRFDPMSPLSLYSKLPFSKEKVPRMGGGKGWGYIDKLGRMMIPPQFDFAGSFCNGLAEVQKGKVRGYIDRSNRYSLCQTSAQPGIQVLCSQYQPKDAPPTAGVPVRAYDCTYEGEGASRKVTCTGGQFTRAPTKTLTYDEFVDSDKRCSTLCDPCASGWESWQ